MMIKRAALGALGLLFLASPLFTSAQSVCPTLSRGMSGAKVLAVQQVLYKAYKEFPTPTGTFGPVTEKALKQGQSEHGIEAVGFVGPKTRAAMGLSCAPTSSTTVTKPAAPSSTAALIQTLLAQVKILQERLAALIAASTAMPIATTTVPIVESVTCTPLASQTQILSCPAGQTGSITQTKTSSCPGPIWSPWTTTASTCTAPTGTASCILDGVTVAHGASRIFFPASTVPAGQTCTGQTRTCTNGTLSGDAPNNKASCIPTAAQSCTFNGQTVANGASVTAYQSSSGSQCVSEQRTCTNGALSGSYTNASCSVSIGTVTSEPILNSFNEVVISGVAAGEFDTEKLKHWNKYFYPYVIQAQNSALSNVYSTELFKLPDNTWKLFYGGYDSSDVNDHTDRIYNAESSGFLSRNKFDFSQPVWGNRLLVINNNGGKIANDPSIVEYEPGKYLMLYSVADASDGTNKIEYSVSTNLNEWYLHMPNNKYVEVYKNSQIMSFMHRPSVVKDGAQFNLYFDQGGDPSALKNNGFNISVAHGGNGLRFSYDGEVFASGSPENGYAGTPEVEKFTDGWIMFYDRALNALSYALSSDGKNFTDKGKLVSNPDTTITNVNVIRDGNRLLGVLYGAAPKMSAVASCEYYWEIGGYCFKMFVNAYFLQKKVVFEAEDGRIWDESLALDENRVVLKLPAEVAGPVKGTLKIYDTDGVRLLVQKSLSIQRGALYSVSQ